ncbi:MAG: hypothetical protein JW846_08535 [Dehalococcoidia bacterium]|nr:hypothetical protein [Dehalococcoidia bacterium]
MDDTAFHYSHTLRIIMWLAILLPILGIGVLLWYFSSDGLEDSAAATEDETHIEEEVLFGDSAMDGSRIQLDYQHVL